MLKSRRQEWCSSVLEKAEKEQQFARGGLVFIGRSQGLILGRLASSEIGRPRWRLCAVLNIASCWLPVESSARQSSPSQVSISSAAERVWRSAGHSGDRT